MKTIEDRLADLREDPTEQANRSIVLSTKKKSQEVSLHHPVNDAGVHLRDDGSVELFSGDSRLVLTQDGTIYIKAEAIILEGDSINLLSAKNEVTVNQATLDPRTYMPRANNFGTITPDFGQFAAPKPELWDNDMVIVGAPAGAEQMAVPISTFFEKVSVFGYKSGSSKIADQLEKLIDGN